jgi:hypothetical protein
MSAGKFIILIRVSKHWMVYTRSEGKQVYATQDAADDDAKHLKAKRSTDCLNRPVYADVLVSPLPADMPEDPS